MRHVPGSIAWVLLASLICAGCASHSSKETDHPSPGRDAELAIEIENHNWSDVVIYLLRGGAPERIGMVTAHSTNTFVLRYRRLGASGNNRLSAYPIGGGSAVNTDNLLVQPGQSIKWTLESDLSRSSLVVY
ncbi:MAG TPA: hypothetical protein VH763_19780 [Gemmatimonadales bacterium]